MKGLTPLPWGAKRSRWPQAASWSRLPASLAGQGRFWVAVKATGARVGHLDGSGEDGRQVVLRIGLEALGGQGAVQVDGQHGDAQDGLVDLDLRPAPTPQLSNTGAGPQLR